jgi:oxygen-independent coproporphyrinogen III oxidase
LLLADDLLGLGVSAISQMGDFYLQNERELHAYYARLDQGQHPVSRGLRVSQEDKLRRYIIMSLICELKLDIVECSRRFGIEFSRKFHQELLMLRAMEADGLVHLDAQEIQVSHLGRPFLRNICMLFDAYLDTRDGVQPPPGFSATL